MGAVADGQDYALVGRLGKTLVGRECHFVPPQPTARWASVTRTIPVHSGSIQRAVLLAFCILFLVVGVVAPWLPFVDASGGAFASGTLLKLGVVLLIAWLAAPQLEKLGWNRLRGTALICVIVVAGAFAIRPRLGAIVGGILLVGGLFFGLFGWIRQLTSSGKSRT